SSAAGVSSAEAVAAAAVTRSMVPPRSSRWAERWHIREGADAMPRRERCQTAPVRHTACMQILPGSPYSLGATADNEGTGVNFALFSEHAERVELCLYDGRRGNRELDRVELPEYTNEIWHGLVPN